MYMKQDTLKWACRFYSNESVLTAIEHVKYGYLTVIYLGFSSLDLVSYFLQQN